MLALGPRLDARQAQPDGVLDGLVVAELEVQEGHVLRAAPVPAVEAFAADQVEGAGDPLAVAAGQHQQHLVRHPLAEQREECPVQIGRPPLARAGVGVEPVEGVPVVLGDLRAGEGADLGRRLGVAALAADGLAPARAQSRQVVVEVAIAGVQPMVLLILAQQQPLVSEEPPLGLVGEIDVQARGPGLFAEPQRPGQQDFARGLLGPRAQHQPRPGGRREGRGAEQLGIVAAAGALIGVRPGPVEHVFPARVGLQIERHDPGDLAFRIADQQMPWRPAGAAAGAAALLAAVEEVEQGEGVGVVGGIAGAGVPGVPSDLGDAFGGLDEDRLRHQAVNPSKMKLSQRSATASTSSVERTVQAITGRPSARWLAARPPTATPFSNTRKSAWARST